LCAGRWSLLGILLLTGVLIANLYNLQIVRFTDYQTRSNENRIKLVPIPPSRGIIYDRNGTPLALNRTIYQIEMMPEKSITLSKRSMRCVTWSI
jgi:penicillin-binding protein 2